MRNLEHTVVRRSVVGSETRDQVIDERIPVLIEIAIGDHTDSIAELCLERRRHLDHESNELALDCRNFVSGELVVAIFVLIHCQYSINPAMRCLPDTYHPVSADEILEEESGC